MIEEQVAFQLVLPAASAVRLIFGKPNHSCTYHCKQQSIVRVKQVGMDILTQAVLSAIAFCHSFPKGLPDRGFLRGPPRALFRCCKGVSFSALFRLLPFFGSFFGSFSALFSSFQLFFGSFSAHVRLLFGSFSALGSPLSESPLRVRFGATGVSTPKNSPRPKVNRQLICGSDSGRVNLLLDVRVGLVCAAVAMQIYAVLVFERGRETRRRIACQAHHPGKPVLQPATRLKSYEK